jgi:hypothetical protein
VLVKKPTLRRYSWCRLHREILDDPRWSLVARRTSAPLPIVEAVIVRLDDHASQSTPRGSVVDFSIAALAARWNVDEEMIGRIYAELEASDIGWIDQDYVVSFWARNPDQEDATAAERQRRKRARDKQAKEDARAAREVIHSHVTSRRDSVTVTTMIRSDHKKENADRPPVDNVDNSTGFARGDEAGLPTGTPGTDVALLEQATSWIDSEGKQMLVDFLQIKASLAETYLARWRRDLSDDLALAQIIRAAERAGYIGSRFHTIITEQWKRHVLTQQKGPQLPLMPPRPGQRRDSA